MDPTDRAIKGFYCTSIQQNFVLKVSSMSFDSLNYFMQYTCIYIYIKGFGCLSYFSTYITISLVTYSGVFINQ